MGKKKGRQRGTFATKSQRAAYQSHVRERASEADGDRRPYCGGWSSSLLHSKSSDIQVGAVGTRTPAERPRITVSLTQLRGILAERRLQDRALDGEMRRFLSQQGTTVRSDAAGRYAAYMRLSERGRSTLHRSDAVCGDASTPLHEPGWLLTYDDCGDFVPNEAAVNSAGEAPAAVSGKIDSIDASAIESSRLPSLQALCVRALAPVLRDYVDECGAGAIHAALGTLPSPVLADLSVLYCSHSRESAATASRRSDWGDEMASVLGCHNQVERLALHSPDVMCEDGGAEEIEDLSDCQPGRSLTDVGILSLVPRLAGPSLSSNHSEGKCAEADDGDVDEAPDSWEDLDVDAAARIEGCTNLRRLELCHARHVSAPALSSLLRRCRRITHLGLSGSLDVESGPALLLDGTDGIAALLTDLRVLDLSHCDWLTDAALSAFLLDVVPATGASSLVMVSVSGCGGVTLAQVDELNERLGGRPYVATAVQRRRRCCLSQPLDVEEEGCKEPLHGELVAVKRWRDKRSRAAKMAAFGMDGCDATQCDDDWRDEGVVSVSVSAN